MRCGNIFGEVLQGWSLTGRCLGISLAGHTDSPIDLSPATGVLGSSLHAQVSLQHGGRKRVLTSVFSVYWLIFFFSSVENDVVFHTQK